MRGIRIVPRRYVRTEIEVVVLSDALDPKELVFVVVIVLFGVID